MESPGLPVTLVVTGRSLHETHLLFWPSTFELIFLPTCLPIASLPTYFILRTTANTSTAILNAYTTERSFLAVL